MPLLGRLGLGSRPLGVVGIWLVRVSLRAGLRGGGVGSRGFCAVLAGGVLTGIGRSTRFYAVVSIVAAVVTIGLKFGAYLLTGSVGVFSDAAAAVGNLGS